MLIENSKFTIQPDQPSKGSVTLLSAWLLQYKDDGEPLAPKLPLNLVYLASSLVHAGYQAEIVDLQFEDQKADRSICVSELITRVLRDSGPIIAISCMSDMLPFVLLALQEWRSSHPNSLVILGGPGPTSSAEEILNLFPEIDVIVCGEGEAALVEVLNAYYDHRSFADILGIGYREHSHTFINHDRQREPFLDSLLPLVYASFPTEKYHHSLPISTSRGCPYHCSFCSAARLWPHKTTWHSLPAILFMLKELTQDDRRRFIFVDDTFVSAPHRIGDLCDSISRELPPISWHCNGRVNLINPPLLEKMAQAGCQSIFYGIESGSDRILRNIQKGFGAQQAYELVKLTCEYLPIVTASFIWGFPDETWEEFEQTRTLYLRMSELPEAHVQLNMLVPYPNIPLLNQYNLPLIYDPEIMLSINQLNRRKSSAEENLIRKHPHLFSCFYQFNTPELKRKIKSVTRDQHELS